jgi:iron complex outermembrane recepter protein
MSVWTDDFNARWKPTDNGTYYVRAARGYRPGGVLFPDPLVPNSPTQYLSDTVWNYEVGAKVSALDGALQGDIAAFYIDWTDIQLNYFGADGRTKIGHGGGATSKGVELQGSYMPVTRLTLAGNAAYTKTRLTSIDAATSIATGAVVGDELPFNPQWTLALRADYVFPLWGEDTGNVGAGYRYKDGFSATFPGDTGTRAAIACRRASSSTCAPA